MRPWTGASCPPPSSSPSSWLPGSFSALKTRLHCRTFARPSMTLFNVYCVPFDRHCYTPFALPPLSLARYVTRAFKKFIFHRARRSVVCLCVVYQVILFLGLLIQASKYYRDGYKRVYYLRNARMVVALFLALFLGYIHARGSQAQQARAQGRARAAISFPAPLAPQQLGGGPFRSL